MTRDHCVCVDTADWDARLAKYCCAVCHVLIVRTEIQRQSYLKLRDVDYPERLILQAVLREDECWLLISCRICESYLLAFVQPSVVLLYLLAELRIWGCFRCILLYRLYLLQLLNKAVVGFVHLLLPCGALHERLEGNKESNCGKECHKNKKDYFSLFHADLAFSVWDVCGLSHRLSRWQLCR